MKYFLPILIILSSIFTFTVEAADKAIFNTNFGIPKVITDATQECTGTATIYYTWTSGFPGQAYDATATCTAVSASAGPKAIIRTGILRAGKI